MDGELVADFVKKQIKIQDKLQARISELEDELAKLKDEGGEYFLYKDILRYIAPNIHFTYNMTEVGGEYVMELDPPVVMPIELINQFIEDIKNYNSMYNE